MAGKTGLAQWSLTLFICADVPYSVVLCLLGALGLGADERLGDCILRLVALGFAIGGGLAALVAAIGATRAGFWRVCFHNRLVHARAVALLAALIIRFLLDRLSFVLGRPSTSEPLSLLDTQTTAFLLAGAAAAAYAHIYRFFLNQTRWYLKRNASLDILLSENASNAFAEAVEETPSRLETLQFMGMALDVGVSLTLFIAGTYDNAHWMLTPGTMCILQGAGLLLFTLHLLFLLYLRAKCSQFMIAYSILLPLRAVVASFTVSILAWAVMDDQWARECAGGVLVVAETPECQRGLWIRVAPLGVWMLALAHAAFTLSALNGLEAFTRQRTAFIVSLRELNREFCHLARTEGVSSCACRAEEAQELEEVPLTLEEALLTCPEEADDFVLVVGTERGGRDVLVRGRNLEAEVAALERLQAGGASAVQHGEVLFTVAEEEDDCD